MGQRLPGLSQGWADLVVAGHDKRYAGERAANERKRQNISDIGSIVGGAIAESRARSRTEKMRADENARSDAIRREGYARQDARYAVEDARHALSDQDRRDATVYKVLGEKHAELMSQYAAGDSSVAGEIESVERSRALVEGRMVGSAQKFASKNPDYGCADGTCTLPKNPVVDGRTDFQRDVPTMANDDQAREDLGYRPDGSRQPRWNDAVPKPGPTGSISTPSVSPVDPSRGPLDEAVIERARAESRKARAEKRAEELNARLKKPFSSMLARNAAVVEAANATAEAERANVDAGLAGAKSKMVEAEEAAKRTERVSAQRADEKRQQLRVSRINEFRTKLGAYGIRPTSEDMKRIEPDLSNPNNEIVDVDALIEKHFPGAKSAHESKHAKPSADRRTPEEQAKYEADLEVARKASGSPKASKPKDDDTLTKAEDADLSARQKAADAAEKDAVAALDEARRLAGDRKMNYSDPLYEELADAIDAAKSKSKAVRDEAESVAKARLVEAEEREDMADDERAAFDRLTPKQKREYIAGRRERKGRGG